MKINILDSVGFSPSTADITETYSLLLYIHISNKFFVASAEETAQASHLYYKFVSGSSLPMIQKHERNILCRERLKSAWKGEAENVTVSSRQLFVANSKNWNGGNLWKSSDQSEACVLSSHMCQITEIFAKPETENEPETFVRTRKERDSVWQECGDYSQADYKPEHEERSPFSALGMGRHRNPAWKEKHLPSLWSIAKMKSAGLMVLGLRLFAQQASATWADKIKVKDVPCTLLFLIGICFHIAYSTEAMPWQKTRPPWIWQVTH